MHKQLTSTVVRRFGARPAARLPKNPLRRLPRKLAVVLAATLALTGLGATPAQATPAGMRLDLRVLVFTDGSAGVDLVMAQLEREGVPYDRIDLNQADRPALTASRLADTVGGKPRGKYNGVVVPNEGALAGAELTVLAAYEQRFGVRQLDAYTAPSTAVGTTTTWSGVLDGASLAVTDAGKAGGFGYLAGALAIDDLDPAVTESYGYLATANAGVTYTPLVTATAPASGSLLGVYRHDGRDELVVTLAMNRYQSIALQLGHGLVTWLTAGLHLGNWRNYFSLHVDDVFLPDARWDADGNCTVEDGCPVTTTLAPIRMDPVDVDVLAAWQNRQGIKLELAFNGEGSVDAGSADPLTAKLVADRSRFRWLNHTYSHPYVGCLQDFSVMPWRCETDPATGATRWYAKADLQAQITENVKWAKGKGISVNAAEVVTGEHSGLKSLPQMPADNPNLAPALTGAGVTVIASDNSREQQPRRIGTATTVPRYPMNIFYNVSTAADETDEYNWIYTSAADGGSGLCENNATSTCIAPLPTATGYADYIVPLETRIAYGHVVAADPRPHYVHQSNLTDDRIVYPVLDALLARYRATYTAATPLLNPRMNEISTQLGRQSAWQAAITAGTVEAYVLDGRVTVVNRGGSAMTVPVTVPAGTRTIELSVLGIEIIGDYYGDTYGPERSEWSTLGKGSRLSLRLPG